MRGIAVVRNGAWAIFWTGAEVEVVQAFLPVSRVGQALLPVIEFVSGGHSCPPERIRIRSEGKNAPARGFETHKNVCPTLPNRHAAWDQVGAGRPNKFRRSKR